MIEKKWYFLFLIIFVGIIFLVKPTFAHPGRTDSSGCHTCRTNCSSWGLSYGEYHCHRAKALPQPEEPIKSNLGSPGYTEPAPEYKLPSNNISTNNINNSNISTKSPLESFWLWVIGIGVVGYILYAIFKKKD